MWCVGMPWFSALRLLWQCRMLPAVGSNPKESAWHAPKQAQRTRKVVAFTLSDEARERLDELAAERRQPKSVVVEDLIMKAKPPR